MNSNRSIAEKYKIFSSISEVDLKKPFDYGWRREFVKKLLPISENNENGEIYYVSPAGQKLRNKKQVEAHLDGINDGVLNINMFCFAKRVLGFEGEIVRSATSKGYRPTKVNCDSAILNTEETTLINNANLNIEKNLDINTNNVHMVRPPTATFNANRSLPQSKQSSAINDQVNVAADRTYSKSLLSSSVRVQDVIDSLKHQLKEKEDIISDLKLCLTRNEAQIRTMEKQHTSNPPISAEELKAEIRKKLPMLTDNQLALMTKEKKRVNWTSDEISTGFAHCYLGKRGYNFTIQKLGIPQPSIRTLQKWGEQITIAPGMLTDCFVVLKALRNTLREGESQVLLSFDEMKCKCLYEYNKTLDMIMGPNDQMQTIMVRGLFAKFKQPIYVDFDQKVTHDILMWLITKLHEIGFNVVGCVNDNGGGNVGLWSYCGVNFKKTTIKHPVTGFDIFMFSDVPHLLKLLRNWFIDGGFLLEDGIELNQAKIRELLKMNTEISPLHKVSLKHLEVVGIERQNVKMACQLFSHSVAQALFKHFPSDPIATKLAEFIEMVSNWFDISNSYSILGIGFKKPYGLGLEQQNEVLDKMYSTISTMNCYNKQKELQNSLQIFQKGILMSITSLKALRTQMDEKFGFKYILTHRLNQDCLENFYSQMRYGNGANDHPTPVQCLYNIKSIILGKNPGLSAHMHCNTIERDPEEYATAMFNKSLPDPVPFDSTEEFLDESLDDVPELLEYNSDDGPEEFLENISDDVAEEILEDNVDTNSEGFLEDNTNEEILEEGIVDLCIEFVSDVDNNNSYEDHPDDITLEFINDLSNQMEIKSGKQTLDEDGLEYIAGWIAWKFKGGNPNYSCSRRESLPSYITDHSYAKKVVFSDSWIDCYSYGGLTKPSMQVFEWVRALESAFLSVHGHEFSNRYNVKRELIEKLKENCPDVPNEVINLFARSRIYMRCKFLNKKRMEEALLKKMERKQQEAQKRKNLFEDSMRSKRRKMKKIVS